MKPTLIALVAGLALPACSSVPLPRLPSPDPRPIDQSTQEMIDYCNAVEARYEYGRKIVGEGNETIAKARSQMDKAVRDIREARQTIETADVELGEIRREWGLRAGETPTTEDVSMIVDPTLMYTLRGRMDLGIKRMRAGEADLADAETRLARARETLARGIDRLDEGQQILMEDDGRCR